MEDTAGSRTFLSDEPRRPHLRVMSNQERPPSVMETGSGIGPLDRKLGGLKAGGIYLVAGTPGPAKLVAALQFLHAGVQAGERVALLTAVEGPAILEIARNWGLDLDDAWNEGRVHVLGFKDDFEMRVLRSTEPLDVLEELDGLIPGDTSRIGVDPGSMFLRGGTKTLLGKSFLDWGRRHPATFLTTLSVDDSASLPSSAEWLVQATDAVFQIERREEGLHQIRVNRALVGSVGEDDPITLQLVPGRGLKEPDHFPTRRRADRPAGAAERLLLISFPGSRAEDLKTWAREAFTTEMIEQPLDAVAKLQGSDSFGGVLIHAHRKDIREAVRTCRAIRPLTGAAIVFASDDALRSTDRINLLEAGADDCLSGGVDLRELGARIRQAVNAGGKPAPDDQDELVVRSSSGGRVSRERFGEELERRREDADLSVFSVAHLRSGLMSPAELEEALTEEIRDEDGDLVTSSQDGCLVLLQGARQGPAHTAVSRLRTRLRDRKGQDPELETRVLSHPVETERVQEVLGSSQEASTPVREQDHRGGPDGAEG